jgi:hypothetical protein
VTVDEVQTEMLAAIDRLQALRGERQTVSPAQWRREMDAVRRLADELSAEDRMELDLEPLAMMNPAYRT